MNVELLIGSGFIKIVKGISRASVKSGRALGGRLTIVGSVILRIYKDLVICKPLYVLDRGIVKFLRRFICQGLSALL